MVHVCIYLELFDHLCHLHVNVGVLLLREIYVQPRGLPRKLLVVVSPTININTSDQYVPLPGLCIESPVTIIMK